MIVTAPFEEGGIRRQVARPAVSAQRTQQVMELEIIRQNDATLHSGNVVREEETKRVEVAEGPGLAAVQFGIHRLAVVLDQVQPVLPGEPFQHVQSRRIAQNADGHNGAGAWRERALEFTHIHVEGRKLHVEEAQLESILL